MGTSFCGAEPPGRHQPDDDIRRIGVGVGRRYPSRFFGESSGVVQIFTKRENRVSFSAMLIGGAPAAGFKPARFSPTR